VQISGAKFLFVYWLSLFLSVSFCLCLSLAPSPSFSLQRDRLLAWLSADFMDESKWVQLRDLSWEIDLISADGITEEDA